MAFARANSPCRIASSIRFRMMFCEPLRAAAALVGLGRVQDAIFHWVRAEKLREATGAPHSPDTRKSYDRHIAAGREMLGEEEFARAWAEAEGDA